MSKRHNRSTGSSNKISLRRWESGQHNKHDDEHWRGAHDTNINADISGYQTTLRIRSTHEIANNPILEGIVRTHQIDVVGANGPTLQVQSENTTYNEARERVWRNWWKTPDAQERRSGVDILRQWIYMLWACGESLEQLVTVKDAKGPVKLRLLAIHPRRLITPMSHAGEQNIALGILLDELGRAKSYFIANENRFGDFDWISPTDAKEIPASDILHFFQSDEPDQIRGVPLAASVLQTIADLRDFDREVLDATRSAANSGILLECVDPSAEAVELAGGSSMPIRRRQISALPPGYRMVQIQANQPSAQYVDFRHERMAEMGRPVGMPLMMVRADSGDHNYSSARFDGQIYARGLTVFQSRIGNHLTRLESLVTREAELAGMLPPAPKDISVNWRFEPIPHADPSKESKAMQMRMQNLELSWSELIAMNGKDPETVLASFKRDKEKFDELGLPYPWIIQTAQSAQNDNEDEEEDKKPVEEEKKGNVGKKNAADAKK
ncbi:TPA: hypothetical protein DDW35_01065 [Candidatus Sumerlaeota bacterium]|nr:hypothetical protein [Candidatus Sumerlaeota bacterium]